ncbi:MAG: hypothetical protein QOH21_3425 [Acidobacteriota bacterium]|jgi:hypothetical protein|nr:hypothetical protein [Acidobacteriota bacterium]
MKDLWRVLSAAPRIAAMHVVITLRIALAVRVVEDPNSRCAPTRIKVSEDHRVFDDFRALAWVAIQRKPHDHVRVMRELQREFVPPHGRRTLGPLAVVLRVTSVADRGEAAIADPALARSQGRILPGAP